MVQAIVDDHDSLVRRKLYTWEHTKAHNLRSAIKGEVKRARLAVRMSQDSGLHELGMKGKGEEAKERK